MIQIFMATNQSRPLLYKQTIETMKKTSIPFDFKVYFDGSGMGQTSTLNQLIRGCLRDDNDVFVRVDDDMWFGNHWLEKMLQAKDKSSVDVLGGAKYPRHNIDMIDREAGVYLMRIAAGPCQMITHNAWKACGPFDEVIPDGTKEDVMFCDRVTQAGMKVGCLIDKTAVIHCGLTGSNGRGRGTLVTEYTQNLCRKVGAHFE